jgi:hypothetical protein
MAKEAEIELGRCERFLERAVEGARASASEVKAVERVVLLKEAIARATYIRLHPKEGDSFHHRNAVELAFTDSEKAWQASLDLREKMEDEEEKVREAVDALSRAGHAATFARERAAKASQLLRWVKQEESLVRKVHGMQEERRLAELAERQEEEQLARDAAREGKARHSCLRRRRRSRCGPSRAAGCLAAVPMGRTWSMAQRCRPDGRWVRKT